MTGIHRKFSCAADKKPQGYCSACRKASFNVMHDSGGTRLVRLRFSSGAICPLFLIPGFCRSGAEFWYTSTHHVLTWTSILLKITINFSRQPSDFTGIFRFLTEAVHNFVDNSSSLPPKARPAACQSVCTRLRQFYNINKIKGLYFHLP